MVQSLLIGLSVMINIDNIISSIKFQYAFFKGQTFKQGKLMKESEQTEKKLYQYWVLRSIVEDRVSWFTALRRKQSWGNF